MSGKQGKGTAERILDAAEGLLQVRGFNAFSYADVAAAVGIQKASLHHHFATKAALGLALIERYRRSFSEQLQAITGASEDATTRLTSYAELYRVVLRRRRMCLCGILAADVATLPKAMRASVGGFFADNVAWLAGVLEEGRTRGETDFKGAAAGMAAFFIASLEGAMLVARGTGNLDSFDEVVERLLTAVLPGGVSTAPSTQAAGSGRSRLSSRRKVAPSPPAKDS